MTLATVFKVLLAIGPLATVLYLMKINKRQRIYELFDVDTGNIYEINSCKETIKMKLLKGETVSLDNIDLSKSVAQSMSNSGYLTHIHFHKINSMNIVLLELGPNMIPKQMVHLGEEFKFKG